MVCSWPCSVCSQEAVILSTFIIPLFDVMKIDFIKYDKFPQNKWGGKKKHSDSFIYCSIVLYTLPIYYDDAVRYQVSALIVFVCVNSCILILPLVSCCTGIISICSYVPRRSHSIVIEKTKICMNIT